MVGGGAFVRAAKSHEAAGQGCQDTALVAMRAQKGLAIVCDGCSSGRDSGVSAALLASAGRSSWLAGASLGWEWGRWAWERARAAMEMTGMSAGQNPATLLAVEIDGATGDASIALWGDGALARIDAQGRVAEMWTGESALNMPAYPAYAFEDSLWAAFESAGGGSAWAAKQADNLRLGIQQGQGGRFWQGAGRLEAGEMILLLSDGIGAVEGLSALSCVVDLAAAKGPGGFMERRARKAIEGWRAQSGGLGDDFSVAALRMPVSGGEEP